MEEDADVEAPPTMTKEDLLISFNLGASTPSTQRKPYLLRNLHRANSFWMERPNYRVCEVSGEQYFVRPRSHVETTRTRGCARGSWKRSGKARQPWHYEVKCTGGTVAPIFPSNARRATTFPSKTTPSKTTIFFNEGGKRLDSSSPVNINDSTPPHL